MSGAMTGADAEAVRRLAARCAEAATQIDGMARTLRSRLYSAGWEGADAATFQRDWEGRHAPALMSVASGLRATGERLIGEAEEQTAASTVRSGAAAPPVISVLASALGVVGGRQLPPADLVSLASLLARITDPAARLEVAAAWERAWTAQAGVDGAGRFGIVPWEYSATASLEARVHADASAQLTADGVSGQIMLGGTLAATLAASGRIGNDHVNARGSAHVGAEASAEAVARAHLGPDGGSVRAGVAAGARVEAGVDGNVKVSGVDVGGRAEVYAGLDFHAHGEASFTADRIKAEIEIGAAFGVGGGVSADVDISPREIAEDLSREAEERWNGLWGW